MAKYSTDRWKRSPAVFSEISSFCDSRRCLITAVKGRIEASFCADTLSIGYLHVVQYMHWRSQSAPFFDGILWVGWLKKAIRKYFLSNPNRHQKDIIIMVMNYNSRSHWPTAWVSQLMSSTKFWIWVRATIRFLLFLGSRWRSLRYTLVALLLVSKRQATRPPDSMDSVSISPSLTPATFILLAALTASSAPR